MNDDTEDLATYIVIINDEEQYSLWKKDKVIPSGWVATGKEGPKEECIRYVDETWTDMRPLSLRRKMDQGLQNH